MILMSCLSDALIPTPTAECAFSTWTSARGTLSATEEGNAAWLLAVARNASIREIKMPCRNKYQLNQTPVKSSFYYSIMSIFKLFLDLVNLKADCVLISIEFIVHRQLIEPTRISTKVQNKLNDLKRVSAQVVKWYEINQRACMSF